MKVSTILLTTIFIGAVCFMSMHTRHRGRTVLFHHPDSNGSNFGHDDASSSDHSHDTTLLRELRGRDAKLRKQVREIESVLKKIENGKRYLKERMTEWSRQSRLEGIDDSELENTIRRAAGDSQATLLAQYKSLEEDEAQFRAFLEQCRGELATLKVKIDLYDLTAKKADMEKFLKGEQEHSPVDDLAKMRRNRCDTSW